MDFSAAKLRNAEGHGYKCMWKFSTFSRAYIACLWAEIYIYKTIATIRDRFPDLEVIEIDSSFLIIADLWAEMYIFYSVGGHIGSNLVKLHFQANATTIYRFSDLDII